MKLFGDCTFKPLKGPAETWQAEEYDVVRGALEGFAIAAEGGEAGKLAIAYAGGGEVNGPGGPKGDAIPAMLSDEEYIIPAEVVHYKGTEHFDKLINKTNEALGIPPEDKTMQNGVPVQGVEQ